MVAGDGMDGRRYLSSISSIYSIYSIYHQIGRPNLSHETEFSGVNAHRGKYIFLGIAYHDQDW